MYSNLKLQDCLVRFFFFQKGGAWLREEKMGYNLVEPLRIFKKMFNLPDICIKILRDNLVCRKLVVIFSKSGTLSKNKTKMGQCLTIGGGTGGVQGPVAPALFRLGGMAPPLF